MLALNLVYVRHHTQQKSHKPKQTMQRSLPHEAVAKDLLPQQNAHLQEHIFFFPYFLHCPDVDVLLGQVESMAETLNPDFAIALPLDLFLELLEYPLVAFSTPLRLIMFN
jgi:hypothetical protein